MLYFAYGTDLSDELLTYWSRATGVRVPPLPPRAPAVLLNHRLCFSVYDSFWGGGVADVVPQVGKSVSGVLLDVGPRLMDLLGRVAGRSVDRFGRECGVRRRAEVHVSPLNRGADTDRAATRFAHTFVLQRASDRLVPPTARYQQCLADAAANVGLSQLWVMQLLSFSYPPRGAAA